MDVDDLRQLVREEVEGALDEVDREASGPPVTYGSLCLRLSNALEASGASLGLVESVASHDDSVIELLDDAWRELEVARRQCEGWTEAATTTMASVLHELTEAEGPGRRRIRNEAFLRMTSSRT